jgi:hypothetical protein
VEKVEDLECTFWHNCKIIKSTQLKKGHTEDTMCVEIFGRREEGMGVIAVC